MTLRIFTGTAHPQLAGDIAGHLGIPLDGCELNRFPDGELHVMLHASVRGCDVYLVQPTSPPAETHLLELLLLADACRRAGAVRLTAVMPYFAYARQDRRAQGREALGARLVADLLQASGIQHVVAIDLHSTALEGVFPMPLDHLSAVSLLAKAIAPQVAHDATVVAPDLGAVKLAEQYGHLLHLPAAFVHKTRLTGESVTAERVTGDVEGRAPLFVDDMISTGGTIEAAARYLLDAGCLPEMTVAASHALLVGPAAERLRALPVKRFIVTDSVPAPAVPGISVQVVTLAPLLGEAIQRLHRDESLEDLLARG